MKTLNAWKAYTFIGLAFVGGVGTVVALNGSSNASPLTQRSKFVAAPVNSSTPAENITGLRSLNDSFTGLAEFVLPAVVQIKTVSERATDSEGRRIPISGSEGSGFVYRKDGYIITNEHVVKGAKEVTVVFNDGREVSGTVTSASDWDVAVIKVKSSDLPTLELADSKQVKPGQMVMAIGSPYGLENSVTFGNVSAVGRQNQIGSQFSAEMPRFYPDLIQTDAAINVGNSGGPLVNIDGQVIGMNSSIFSRGGGSNGIGFAIPSSQVKFIVDILISKGKVTRSMLGVEPRDLKPFEKKEKGITTGAYVERVTPDGPAGKSGLKAGDVIVRIGSSNIAGQLDLRNSMLVNSPGEKVKIDYLRDGKNMSTTVTLEEFKAPPMPKMPEFKNQIPDEFGDLFGDGKKFNLDDLKNRLRDQKNDEDLKDVEPLRNGKPKLGVSIENLSEDNRKEFFVPKDQKGVIVGSVEPGSIADKNGIKIGDIIEEFDGVKLEAVDSLIQKIQSLKSGDQKRIKVRRYSKDGQLSIEKEIKF